jgi:hypothetical protein
VADTSDRVRRAVVTGGAQGIGLAVGELLHCDGWEVVLADIRGDAAAEAAARLGAPASAVSLDVSSAREVARAAEEIGARWEAVDALVTAAGIELNAPVGELAHQDWDHVVGVCLTGQFLCLQAFLPMLRAAGGSAVCVGSVMSRAVYPGASAYAAAKAGVEGFVKAAALDCAPEVRINCVMPGTTDTAMVRRDLTGAALDRLLAEASASVPLERVAQPCEIAAVIAFLVSPSAGYITGSSVVVDGGLLTKLGTDV